MRASGTPVKRYEPSVPVGGAVPKYRLDDAKLKIDLDKAIAFYKDRFADASGFTFVLVGNLDLEKTKSLVETYLASLPNTGRVEKGRDVGIYPPKGVVQKTVYRGTEPKATTRLVFTGPCTYAPENRFVLRALTTLVRRGVPDSSGRRCATSSRQIGASRMRSRNAVQSAPPVRSRSASTSG